jgi:hypothetical protein
MKKTIVEIISFLYIVLFFYTGINKLRNVDSFSAQVAKNPYLKDYHTFIAVTIPLLEVLISVMLIASFFSLAKWPRKWGLYAGTVLMAAFTFYVKYMLRTGHLPCTCGGIIEAMSWRQHLYFNTIFTILGIIAIWLNRRASNSEQKQLALS